jgi:hypothetical protein
LYALSLVKKTKRNKTKQTETNRNKTKRNKTKQKQRNKQIEKRKENKVETQRNVYLHSFYLCEVSKDHYKNLPTTIYYLAKPYEMEIPEIS